MSWLAGGRGEWSLGFYSEIIDIKSTTALSWNCLLNSLVDCLILIQIGFGMMVSTTQCLISLGCYVTQKDV